MRRALIIASAAAAVAVGLAGCGGTSGRAADEPEANGSGSPAAESPAGAVKAAYTATTGAKTAALTFDQVTKVAGRSQKLSGKGAVDFAAESTRMALSTSGGGTLRVRKVNGFLYLDPAGGNDRLPAGKSWLGLDTAKIGNKKFGAYGKLKRGAATNPTQVLGYLRGVSRVTEKGAGRIDGAKTTRYTAKVDIDKVMKGTEPAAAKAMKSVKNRLGSDTFPMQLWVDEQGRIRKEKVDLHFTTRKGDKAAVNTTVTLSDFGKDVTVSQPPKAKVARLEKLTRQK